MTTPSSAVPAVEAVKLASEAYGRLKNVVDHNVGFPECVEASHAFTRAAFEAMPALLAPTPPAPSGLVDAEVPAGLRLLGTVWRGGVFWHRSAMDDWPPEGAQIFTTLDATLSGQQGGAVPAGGSEAMARAIFQIPADEPVSRPNLLAAERAWAHARREELEEAAKIAESDAWHQYWDGQPINFCVAAAIRAARPAEQPMMPTGGAVPAGDDPEAEPAFSNGVTHAITLLARVVGCLDWQIRDGSEDRDTDIADTIMGVLVGGQLYDDETGEWARLAEQPAPVKD